MGSALDRGTSIMEQIGIVSIRHKGNFWQLLREVTLVAPHYQDSAKQTQSSIENARPDLQGKVISSVRPSAVAKAGEGVLEPLISHRALSSHPCPTVHGSMDQGFTKACLVFPAVFFVQIRKTASPYKPFITWDTSPQKWHERNDGEKNDQRTMLTGFLAVVLSFQM